MRQLATIMTGVFLVAALASCGDRDRAGSQDESSAAKSSSSADASDDGGTGSSEPGDDEPTSDADTMTLTGEIADGVEPGCLMLEFEGEKYQLIGDKARDLKAGMKVEVTGRISQQAMTTCMEGRVFEVDSVTTL